MFGVRYLKFVLDFLGLKWPISHFYFGEELLQPLALSDQPANSPTDKSVDPTPMCHEQPLNDRSDDPSLVCIG